MIIVSIAVGCVALAVLGQCLFSLALMLYAWEVPERLRATAGPAVFRRAKLSFTVLLPAREEQAVIGETIARLAEADYPSSLLEIVVICQEDDLETIAAARSQIDALGNARIRLEIYSEPPFNKPHALMVGLAASSNDVVAVFDAEDDVDSEIFRVINTLMLEREAKVVQGGVQLMNISDHWFSGLNCLEYFFYFGSRMHFNARVGMVPLGGNTVFIRRELVERVGGWDITCLTEDADIGLRISALGEPISVVYDSNRVTREETPHSIAAFVRQRTRWHQGFLQILRSGVWRRLPSRRARLLALVTLMEPTLDALLLFYFALLPLSIVWLRLPDLIAILTFLPLYGMVLQLIANYIGVVMFARRFETPVPLRVKLRIPLVYLPYQWMISFSALRALYRQCSGHGEWEKTEHLGAHRQLPAPVMVMPATAGITPQEEPVA